MIQLTDEEIRIVREQANNPPVVDGMLTLHIYDEQRAIARVKKFIEWGNGDCDCGAEHKFDIERSVHRHFCPRCWQALEIKEK